MESAVTRALTALLAGLQRERSLTLQTRATTASDSALDTVSTEISRAAEHLGNGRDHDALTELTRAALRVRQSWSYASPLSEAIVVAEQDLRRRIEERFAREWTAPATPDPPPRNRPSPLPTALVTSTAAVVTVAGVTALYANGDLAVAGPYVAPVLVAAAIWLALAWFAGRVARLRARAVTRLRDLARLLRTAPSSEPIPADARQASLAAIEDALRAFAHRDGDCGAADLDRLGRLALTWPRPHPLTTRAARLSRIGRRLSRAVGNTERVHTILRRQTQAEDRRTVRTWDRWLIRFPVGSLFVCLGAVGLHQNDLAAPPAAFGLATAGILAVAAWHGWQQRR